MILLSSGDRALWGNFTSRRDYWMFYPGGTVSGLALAVTSTETSPRSPSAFGPTTITVWRGDSDSSDVRLAHSMDSSASPASSGLADGPEQPVQRCRLPSQYGLEYNCALRVKQWVGSRASPAVPKPSTGPAEFCTGCSKMVSTKYPPGCLVVDWARNLL